MAAVIGASSLAGCAAGPARHPAAHGAAPGPWDWPTYGHDAQHTFHGRTTLTEATASSLEVAWYFPTADAVTATPTVVNGTVYVGSWDDWFYALDLETGRVRWKFRLSAQNAVTPYPGQHPRDVTSDGGLVTSSAWYQTGAGKRPDLVIFGGGYTLYALERGHRSPVLAPRLHRSSRPAGPPRHRWHPHLLLPGGGREQGSLRRRCRRGPGPPGLRRGRQTSTPEPPCGSTRPTSTPPATC